MIRIGSGYDVHKLVKGRPLILGGVDLQWHLGLEGHSDADVLLHAICDACLGAAALGDIGKHFPPNDDAYKDADSRILLRAVIQLLKKSGWVVSNLDCTVIAEQPKISPWIETIRSNIADDMAVDVSAVSVKATTTEGLGYVGEQKGIAAQAVVLITSS